MTYVGKKPADIIATAVDTTTGTFSGDLTVDTNTLYVDSANNKVGVGTVSPQRILHLNEATSGSNYLHITNSTTGTTSTDGLIFGIDGSEQGYIWHYEAKNFILGTNNTERMRIDSSGNVGIGTSSPSVELSIAGSDPQLVLWEGTDGASSSKVQLGTGAVQGFVNIHKGDGTRTVQLNSDGDTYLNGGNVGIGTSSPSETLEINSGIGNIGAKLVSTDNLAVIAFKDNSTTDVQYLGANGDNLVFHAGTTPSERMRIDSNGRALINLTGEVQSSNAKLQISNTADDVVLINRTNDGDQITFHVNGNSASGSIGTFDAGYLYIASTRTTDAGIKIGTSRVVPSTTTGADRDDAIDLGYSSGRWKDLYLSGGVVFGSTGGAVTSKTLDDYEEGTCTFTYTGSSGNPTVTYGSVRYGFYTKIGRKVFIEGRIRTDAFSGGSGLLQVSGLPFTVSNIDPDKYTSGGGIVSNDFGSNQPHSTMAIAGTTSFYCIYGNYNVNNISDCQDGSNKNQIQFSFFYMAI
jgi:hypothetical protein